MKKIYHHAFTMAEVLITLAVIGIVAALTIPALVNNYKERQTVTALKKNYSVLNNALNLAIAENGPIGSWNMETITFNNEDRAEGGDPGEATDDFRSLDNITKYLNIAKDCGNSVNGCFSHQYKRMNGQNERNFENLPYYRKFILNDGTLMAFQGYGVDAEKGEVWVDVNGAKGPNVVGKDMFLFLIDTNKVVPYGRNDIEGKALRSSGCCKKYSGYPCGVWVLQYENQDYLHCDDLEWGKKTKC